ncbi:MAG: PAS domain S-box protein [Pseudohongiellaceae bacterium]
MLLSSAAEVAGGSFEIAPGEPRSFQPDIFVLGPAAPEPLALAQRLHAEVPPAQILFLVATVRLERFRASLPFVPHMASAWTADVASSPAFVADILVRAAQTSRQRAESATLADRINMQLGRNAATSQAPEIEARRLQQLALSEAYLATLLSEAPEAFIALSPEGHILAWNGAAARLFGIVPDRAIGCLASDVLTAEAYDQLADAIDMVQAGDSAAAREVQLMGANGQRWIEVSLAPLSNDDGKVITVSMTLRDVTARRSAEARLRASEQRYRTLTETLPQLVWTCRPDGTCDYLSKQWVDYTGIPEVEQLGLTWLDRAVHPQDREPTLEHWRGAVAGMHPYDIEFRIRRADGSYRWFKTRATPIYGDDGAIAEWFGTCTDIEDIVQAREMLSQSAEELGQRVEAEVAARREAEDALRQSQKMEAVGQLTGGIAHDFNNLLQGITGSLDLLQRRVSQGRYAELDRFINGAMTSTSRASALTHRLLAFSRRQPLDPRPVRTNSLVASMEDLLRRTLGERVELELVLAGGLWQTRCDPNQLESAILNLAINARDAMPDGGKLIIETCNAHLDQAYADQHPEVKSGQYVCVAVTDTGVGMDADTMKKAFEPFFTTKPIGQGTGLGLSMIYGFARQSEGHAKLYSQLGQGTTSKLYLPRLLGEPELEEPEARGTAQPAESGETVLVVEDEPLVRSLILEVLEELGYRALEAADGPAGLDILQSRRRIDLLITDIGLPGLNGRQVAEAARQQRPTLKVLYMTGYAENAALAAGFLEPGMAMMTKPFAMDALSTRIRDIMENSPEL